MTSHRRAFGESMLLLGRYQAQAEKKKTQVETPEDYFPKQQRRSHYSRVTCLQPGRVREPANFRRVDQPLPCTGALCHAKNTQEQWSCAIDPTESAFHDETHDAIHTGGATTAELSTCRVKVRRWKQAIPEALVGWGHPAEEGRACVREALPLFLLPLSPWQADTISPAMSAVSSLHPHLSCGRRG